MPNDARNVKIALSSGTCTDGAGTGVAGVKIRIQRSDGNWLNWGTDWLGTTGSWDPTTLTGGVYWEKAIDPSFITNGFAYYINVKAQDNVSVPAPNYETSYSTNVYIYDTTGPNSNVNSPANNSWKRTLTVINGTVNDPTIVVGGLPSSANMVETAIMRLSDNLYWNGANGIDSSAAVWSTAALTSTAYSSYTWTYAIGTDSFWTLTLV